VGVITLTERCDAAIVCATRQHTPEPNSSWVQIQMDKITKSLVSEFAASHPVDNLPESDQFEHFVAFVTLRRHHARAFATHDIVVGTGGGDTSIDSIAIIVRAGSGFSDSVISGISA
jgi:hypothetical protein